MMARYRRRWGSNALLCKVSMFASVASAILWIEPGLCVKVYGFQAGRQAGHMRVQSAAGLNVNVRGSDSKMRVKCSDAVDEESALHVKYYKRAELEHRSEIAKGVAIFGDSKCEEQEQEQLKEGHLRTDTTSDEAFFTLNAGVGNAGPDELNMKNAHLVHGTVKPIFTPDECQALIDQARAKISSDLAAAQTVTSPTHKDHTKQTGKVDNAQLCEAKLSELPLGRDFLKSGVLSQALFPLLKSRFAIDAHARPPSSHDTLCEHNQLTQDDDLVVYDALIKGQIGATNSQPVHRDSSFLTINVALSPLDAYQHAGGTYFPSVVQKDLQKDHQSSQPHTTGIVHIEQGHVLCHAGGVMHAGVGIQSGERWVMVVFVLSRKHVQIARRLHAMGGRIITNYDAELPNTPTAQSINLDKAERVFHAALNVAPKDHLIVTSIGSIHNQKGRNLEAEQCLKDAAIYYPSCHKAAMALGQIYMAKRAPLEALQVYSRVLETIGESDLRDGAWGALKAVGWNARKNAAQCALIAAHQTLNLDEREGGTKSDDNHEGRLWAKHQMPHTLKQLDIILRPLQRDEDRAEIISMMNMARDLLELANS